MSGGNLPGRLTIEQVTEAPPKKRPYKLFDGKGVYVVIEPDGGRQWRVRFQCKGKTYDVDCCPNTEIMKGHMNLPTTRSMAQYLKALARDGKLGHPPIKGG